MGSIGLHFCIWRHGIHSQHCGGVYIVWRGSPVSKLRHFKSQDLSNMLWAYAKVGTSKSNLSLFKAAGDSIVAHDNLVALWPQAVLYCMGDRRRETSLAIQMLRRSHHRIERLDRVQATRDVQHFMGLCNLWRVESSAFQKRCQSHRCIERLEWVHATGDVQHFMGLCNCGWVASSAFQTLRQTHRCVERLEWVQFSRPFQYHVGVCNRGQVKSSALEMLRQSHHHERLEWV